MERVSLTAVKRVPHKGEVNRMRGEGKTPAVLYGKSVKPLALTVDTKAFEKADCIMMPVSPTTAFKVGEKTDDPLQMYMADIYTIATNLSGVPGISVPCGFDGDNLPIGLQIMTSAFTEEKLLRIARMFEKHTDWHRRKPEM